MFKIEEHSTESGASGSKPAVPVRPVVSLGSFRDEDAAPVPSILDVGDAVFVTAGRTALALALKDMGLAEGDGVLVPAYHCTVMVAPVAWAKATPVFYRLRPDLSIDLDDVRSRIDGATRALIVTHYFGFPQDMPAVRALCDDHGLILIEDCAHGFFGRSAGRALGAYGDYSIASAMKFFPAFDGGCLVSATRPVGEIALERGTWLVDAKALVNIVEDAVDHGRLSGARPFLRGLLGLKNFVWGRIKKRDMQSGAEPGVAATWNYDQSFRGDVFVPSSVHKPMTAPSRLVLKRASRSRIIARRRRHFMALAEALSGLAHASLPFTSLADDVVPHMFPILFDDVDRAFAALLRDRVPLQRFGHTQWQGFDDAICPVARQWSRQGIQIPCHQELEPEELRWIIERVGAAAG